MEQSDERLASPEMAPSTVYNTVCSQCNSSSFLLQDKRVCGQSVSTFHMLAFTGCLDIFMCTIPNVFVPRPLTQAQQNIMNIAGLKKLNAISPLHQDNHENY